MKRKQMCLACSRYVLRLHVSPLDVLPSTKHHASRMILCLGTTPTVQRSLIFDRVTVDGVNRARAVHEYASGKSVNVARVAQAMGSGAVATGFAGGDRGAFLLRELAAAGINHDFVAFAGDTRLCTTVIDEWAGTATELVEEHPAVGPDAWAALEAKFASLVIAARVCVLSGSLATGGPADFYARCLRHAAAMGCRAILDARGEPLRQALQQQELIVKLNREELAATVGRSLEDAADLQDAMAEVRPPGGAVIVTLGSAGAAAFDGKDFWDVRSPSAKAVSAVGSGDAFAAGLAVGLLRGQAISDACALAAACGAANALSPLAGFVRPEDVAALMADAVVTRRR